MRLCDWAAVCEDQLCRGQGVTFQSGRWVEAGKVWAGMGSLPANILKSVTNHKNLFRGVQGDTALLAPGRRDREDSCHLPDPSLLKGSSGSWTPGHQAVVLSTLKWWPALPPPTPRLSQRGHHRKQCACEQPWLRWWQRQPRHHDDSHFLGNRVSHLYLCWDPPQLVLSRDLGAIFSLPQPCVVGRMI